MVKICIKDQSSCGNFSILTYYLYILSMYLFRILFWKVFIQYCDGSCFSKSDVSSDAAHDYLEYSSF